MEYIPIKALQVGQSYSQIFLISGIAVKPSRKNPNARYLQITFKDMTGTIRGCLWDEAKGAALENGKFVHADIVVESYNNDKTFIVKKICIVPGENIDNLIDYLPGPNEYVLATLKTGLEKTLGEIEDPHIRDILNNANQRVKLLDLLATSAYKLDGPLSHRGGLLEHTDLNLCLALDIAHRSTATLDKSLIIAGCLFRNLGYASVLKLSGNIFVPQESYHLLGVRYVSAMWINHILIGTESDLQIEIPESKKLALQHICFANDVTDCKLAEAKIVVTSNNIADQLHGTT